MHGLVTFCFVLTAFVTVSAEDGADISLREGRLFVGATIVRSVVSTLTFTTTKTCYSLQTGSVSSCRRKREVEQILSYEEFRSNEVSSDLTQESESEALIEEEQIKPQRNTEIISSIDDDNRIDSSRGGRNVKPSGDDKLENKMNVIPTVFFPAPSIVSVYSTSIVLVTGPIVTSSVTCTVQGQNYRPLCSSLSVSQLAYKWAPLIWLHSEEQYYPSSVPFFMANVNVKMKYSLVQSDPRQDNIITDTSSKWMNLQTKLPLGCASCTNLPFLNGQSVDNGSVPVYASIRAYNDDQSTIDIQYEMFYPYNRGKDICLGFRINGNCIGQVRPFGNHVGDWEKYVIRIQNGEPKTAFIASHDFGSYYTWNQAANRFDFYKKRHKGETIFPSFMSLTDDGHPIVYAANGSHGLWAQEGKFEFLPKVYDYTNRGKAWKTWENLVLINWTETNGKFSNDLRWVNFKGRWGNKKSGCGIEVLIGQCILKNGPKGPDLPNDFNRLL